MQMSIAELTEEVNSISPNTIDEYSARSSSPVQAQTSGRSLENSNDDVTKMTSKLNSIQLEKATDGDSYYSQNLRRSVREAALSKPVSNTEWSDDKSSDDGSEHFFIPLSTGVTRKETSAAPNRRKQRLFSSPQQVHARHKPSNLESLVSHVSKDSNGLAEYENQGNEFQTDNGLGCTGCTVHSIFPGIDESVDQVFSPPLLMDSSFFPDTYEDLLAPLSDTDAALMERSRI